MISEIQKMSVWRRLFDINQLWQIIANMKNILLYFIKKTEVRDYNSPGFFELWLKDYEGDNQVKLAGWGPEFLDEIWKLSEQVRANRRDK